MHTPYCCFWGPPPCMLPLSAPPYPPHTPIPASSDPCKTQAEIFTIKVQNEVPQEEQSCGMVKLEQEQPKRKAASKNSRFKYPKKNVESNVVNQVISFLTNKAKSESKLRKVLHCPVKISSFYLVLREVKRNNKHYMGRNFLQGLLEMEQDHPIHFVMYKKSPKGGLSLREIREAIIKLTNYFLRNLIVPTLLTSSKLDKSTLQQHLQRAREIYAFVNSKPLPPL